MNPANEKRGIALIERIALKDRKAFEEFYYLFANALGGYLIKMLNHHDWADECVNDVMLTIWQSAERFDAKRGKLTTWLFGIAHNKGLKTLERVGRHAKREVPDEWVDAANKEDDNDFRETPTAKANPERELISGELGEALTWALSVLSLEHRCVIELCFKNGFSYQEIAEIMACPENTVKTRMFHARKRLAELFEQRGYSLAELTGGT